jgi:uncharacterized membrane protein YiaA
MAAFDVFIIESNRKQILVLNALLHILGWALFWVGDYKFETSISFKAIYFIGIFLALVGAYGIILSENIRTIVDGREQSIFYRSQSLFFGKLRTIPFTDVGRVSISKQSRSSPIFETYQLVVILKSGEALPTGKWSRFEKDLRALAERITSATGCSPANSWH